jgi:hypothetical protein
MAKHIPNNPDKYRQGEFTPRNPEKYIGTYPIYYRSGLELHACMLFDKHPSILYWSSESLQIPYQNPLTGRHTIYIPDYVIVYVDKDGKQHAEIIEIKPLKETGFAKSIYETRSKRDKAAILVNHAKWQAAMAFAAKNNMTFRVMDETQICHQGTIPTKPRQRRKK